MKLEKIKIQKLKPAVYNPRQISTKDYNDLKKSIIKFSMVDPLIINNDYTIIGGHQRYKICKELGYTEIGCVILDLNKKDEKELNIRLNKNTGEFDMDILSSFFDIEELTDWGFRHIDLDINIDKLDNDYTTKIERPQYLPKKTKPSISSLVDTQKQKQLEDKILKSDISKEEKDFLIKASQRHLVFDYSKIADYYAHSNDKTKKLIEDSALVIIDYNDAIENGYIELSDSLQKLFDSEN